MSDLPGFFEIVKHLVIAIMQIGVMILVLLLLISGVFTSIIGLSGWLWRQREVLFDFWALVRGHPRKPRSAFCRACGRAF